MSEEARTYLTRDGAREAALALLLSPIYKGTQRQVFSLV